MNTPSSSIPQLHPITLTDWLDKLGEKALLAWLQFHSWKAEHDPGHQPYCLRYSLNKLIRKLKMGKATFYQKILNPLLRYGFVELKPTENANRETHLVLYFFPQNCPENAVLPLNPVEDSTPPTSSPEPQPEPPQKDPYTKKEPDHLELAEHLPEELRTPILSDPKQVELLPNIINVYQRVQKHPCYTHPSFLRKLSTCIKYAPNKQCFAAYFHRSLLNEWNQQQRSSPPPRSPLPPKHPNDVPEWVWMQQERQKEITPSKPTKLDSDQQAIIDDLLNQFKELGYNG